MKTDLFPQKVEEVSMESRPLIAITMGDPSGIGPEIIAKALLRQEIWEICRPIVVGDLPTMERAIELLGTGQRTRPLRSLLEMSEVGEVPILQATAEDLRDSSWGQVDPRGGRAQVEFIKVAVDLALEGKVRAMVTAPINKVGLRLAGVSFPGHTEMLAHLTGAKRFAMMLAGEKLRVVPVTIHCSLKEAIESLSEDGIWEKGLLTHDALRSWFRVERPKLAVCGLNPHAGDGGLFGDEEQRIIEPAIERLRKEGIDAEGPMVPDAVFRMAAQGRYQAVLAMYHDQGLIPIKLLEMEKAVNLTLGLPIIRTSVDHGTAYDIAGKGIASEESLVQAIKLACKLAQR